VEVEELVELMLFCIRIKNVKPAKATESKQSEISTFLSLVCFVCHLWFESQASHFRFSTDKEIDIAPLREALDVDINYLPAFDD
jgi:hypothetical protein